jgi:hypothetical protein
MAMTFFATQLVFSTIYITFENGSPKITYFIHA